MLGHAEQSCAKGAYLVRCLGGGPDRDLLARCRPLDHDAPRLHRHCRVGLLVDVLAHNVRSGGEHLLERGRRSARNRTDDIGRVLRMHELTRALGSEVVDHRRERLVVDVYQVGGILGDVAVSGDDESDRVADEAHLPIGERGQGCRRRPAPHHRVPLLAHAAVEVGGREYGVHAGERERRRGVDPNDASAGEGAAYEAGVQHARASDVVDEGPTTCEQACILHSADTCADIAGGTICGQFIHRHAWTAPP